MRKSFWITLSALCVLGAGLLIVPACGTLFKSEAEKAQALSVNESQAQQVAQAQATAMQNLAVAKAASDEALAKRYQQEVDINKAMQAGITAQHEVIAKTPVGEQTNWGAGLSTLGGLLPPPFNAIVMLGGLIATGIQTARKSASDQATEAQIAISNAIVNAHDTAAAADPQLKSALATANPVINAELAKVDGAHEFVSAARS